jgi:regulator of sigma E protease
VIGAVDPAGAGARAGLQAGDLVIRVNDKAVETWDEFDLAVLAKANRQLTMVVKRDGSFVDLVVTPEASGDFDLGELKVAPFLRPQIIELAPGKPAESAGFKPGDLLLAVGGERWLGRDEIVARIQKSTGTPMVFTVARDGRETDISVVPEANGSVGIIGATITYGESRRVDPDLLTAMSMSVSQTIDSAKEIGSTLAGLFTRETPVNNLVGPVGIAQLSGRTAQLGWIPLLAFMSMISLNLGLLNLMPIPVLDGGHIAILAMEGLARRDFSMKVKERILMAGFALILMLMVTVIFNDVARILR